MVESILAILVAVLGIWNVLLGRKNKQTEKRLRDREREQYNEKYEIIKRERETADRRLRDLLDHYRGPGGGKA